MTASSLLFVCLGNICRSPLAEGALRDEAAQRGLELTVESAGTGDWHAGEAPDRRAQATARRHGVDVSGLRARQVTADDFRRFDHVIALDHDNLADLRALAPAPTEIGPDDPSSSGLRFRPSVKPTAQLSLLLDWVPGRAGQAVADPWFGDEAGFETTWADVSAAARALADVLST